MLEKKINALNSHSQATFMRFLKIGQAANTSGSPLIGTTVTSESIYPCQDTLQRPCNDLDMSVHGGCKTCLINT